MTLWPFSLPRLQIICVCPSAVLTRVIILSFAGSSSLFYFIFFNNTFLVLNNQDAMKVLPRFHRPVNILVKSLCFLEHTHNMDTLLHVKREIQIL